MERNLLLKLLGIDYGDSRIGIAVSDDLGMFAHPLIVVKNRGIKNNLEDILKIIQERKTEKIVIGFPLNMNGTQGDRCDIHALPGQWMNHMGCITN